MEQEQKITIDYLKDNNLLLFECISGSKAYGLDLPTSDTDIKGVFVLPKEIFYGLTYTPQITNETNDIVYYELKRFIELCYRNNPNILEMLSVPDEFIIFKHQLYDRIKPEMFISKKCKDTFAGYAMTQIKKARGLKKKILNPIPEERKTVLDFCYIVQGQGSIALSKWLDINKFKQGRCGLVNIPHMQYVYALFYDNEAKYNFQGIIRTDNANDVSLSSIPKELELSATLLFNKDAYSKYCKEYHEYWGWVEKRNDERYKSTISHGKNYDAKNMMHTFRLLDMAEEILVDGKISVKRKNRDELLAIKSGEFSYDYLLEQAKIKLKKIDEVYAKSTLPDFPDIQVAEELLVDIREEFYK